LKDKENFEKSFHGFPGNSKQFNAYKLMQSELILLIHFYISFPEFIFNFPHFWEDSSTCFGGHFSRPTVKSFNQVFHGKTAIQTLRSYHDTITDSIHNSI